MIHINRTAHGFTVQVRSSHAADYEVLSTTGRQTFSRKAGALKNIKVQMQEFNSEVVYVQDNTGATPVVIKVYANGTVLVEEDAVLETIKPKKKKTAKKKVKA